MAINVSRIMISRLRNAVVRGACQMAKKDCKPPRVPTNQICCNEPQSASKQFCRPPTVAINGFGRIGKCVLRLAVKNDLNVVAVNQPSADIKAIAHSLRQDTVHGTFNEKVTIIEDSLCINGQRVRVLHEEKPENIKWKDLPVDYVIESTGKFTGIEGATKHITAGAKKVIITAPSSDAPMFVKGVNFECYKKTMAVVSNASCTTNCAAPLIHIMNKKFGVVNCFLTTAHSVTSSQHVHDGLNYSSAVGNIVPASTGAAKAVGIVIPDLKGKIDGDAARVPTLDVSLLKLYMNLKVNATAEAIADEIKKHADCSTKDLIFYYSGSPKFVSSDFIGSQYSAIVDFNQLKVMDKFVTIGAWYDNEMGYSNRVLDLVKHMIEIDEKQSF